MVGSLAAIALPFRGREQKFIFDSSGFAEDVFCSLLEEAAQQASLGSSASQDESDCSFICMCRGFFAYRHPVANAQCLRHLISRLADLWRQVGLAGGMLQFI